MNPDMDKFSEDRSHDGRTAVAQTAVQKSSIVPTQNTPLEFCLFSKRWAPTPHASLSTMTFALLRLFAILLVFWCPGVRLVASNSTFVEQHMRELNHTVALFRYTPELLDLPPETLLSQLPTPLKWQLDDGTCCTAARTVVFFFFFFFLSVW
jgi:hypothetical protein